MSQRIETLAGRVLARFGDALIRVAAVPGELTFELQAARMIEVCTALRDSEEFRFEMLMDLCAVDYLHYGIDEWRGQGATRSGFSRGVREAAECAPQDKTQRFAVVYHLLSISNNVRMRLRVYCPDDEVPMLPTSIDVWSSANWYEREAFDLYGILFDGHPDLRRLLTDYGFIGHPFRKDFPISGHVEVRYDPSKGRVVYQPVSIEPRTLVPKVIREDHRYEESLRDEASFKDLGAGK